MPKGIYKRNDTSKMHGMRNKKHSFYSKNKMSKSHKNHIVSIETRKKISIKLTGLKRPKRTKEHKEKHRLTVLGKKYPNRKKPPAFSKTHLENLSKSKIGHIVKKETREKLSITHTGSKNGMYGIVGEKHHSWKGGLTPIHIKIRNSIRYKKWQKKCLKRDNYTCQKTGKKGGKLVVHHILNFSSNPNLRYRKNNGITLSDKSHREFHKKYGVKNNTRKQLLEFLNY